MKRFAKFSLNKILQTIPLNIYSRFFPQEVVGFFYHAVSDEPMPHIENIYPPVSVERFENALIYLKQKFNPITYEELHAHRANGVELPPRALHLSLDDGFRECFTVVRPLLLRHKFPCTFFVSTDWIDNEDMFFDNKVSLCIEKVKNMGPDTIQAVLKNLNEALQILFNEPNEFINWIKSKIHADMQEIDTVCDVLNIDIAEILKNNSIYLTNSQIKQMSDEGFTIGSHTRSHPKLVNVSDEEMEAEIVVSSKRVQEITGAELIPFSFPHSASGIERSKLADIRVRYPFLGLFFDTKDLRPDEAFMVNRIWAEHKDFSKLGKSTNIPHLLHDAYQDLVWENLNKRRNRGKYQL